MSPTSIKVALPALLLMLTGCSRETAYYMLHDVAKQECRDILNPEERQECEARHNKTYREYEVQNQNAEEAR